MSDKPEVQGGGLDTLKFIVAIALIVAGIVAYYWFSSQNELLRIAYVVIGLVLGLALAYPTRLGRATWGFMVSSRNEVRKVVWPTREETVQTTLAVIVVVLILGVMMWLLDIFLFWALRGLTGQGG
ncbi:MAG TPA: preprotein translocase subunit SecE [Gammaproteobacteria bacterium]|nr:preprotein translocase subunit SecE [Gammaproteobacteria bacterium]